MISLLRPSGVCIIFIDLIRYRVNGILHVLLICNCQVGEKVCLVSRTMTSPIVIRIRKEPIALGKDAY